MTYFDYYVKCVCDDERNKYFQRYIKLPLRKKLSSEAEAEAPRWSNFLESSRK
jgi:hypothetical protein